MTVNNRTQLHRLIDSLPDALVTELLRFAEFLLFKLQRPELPTTGDDEDKQTPVEAFVDSDEFFSYAGLWEGREVSQTTLRERAWPEQSP